MSSEQRPATPSPATPSPAPPAPRTVGVGTLVAALLATALVAGGGTWFVARSGGAGAVHGEAAAERYQCPMHPTIVQDHAGDCPICGMKLVKMAAAGSAPVEEVASEQWQCPVHPSILEDHPGECPVCDAELVRIGGEAHGEVKGLAAVTIDPARQQLIGLTTAQATLGTIGGEWRTVGRVAIDETRVKHINLKVSGFVERIHVDFVGRPVRKGEPLFALYSPDLLSAQEEYLLAVKTRNSLAAAGGMPTDGDALVNAARRKLQLWDVPPSAIERLERTGEPTKTLTFYSPISGVVVKKDVVEGMKLDAGAMPYEIVDLSEVWVLADVYESELRHVKLRMPASLTLKAYPNRTFEGRVSFIDPLLDPRTRTVKVRLAFPNPGGALKPEMFGEVVLRGKPRQAVRVPADALIDSGREKVVFVALGGGKFQPREVKVGDSDGRLVEVVAGLEPGESVVTRANFLVDSESRLRASLAALTSGKSAAPKGAAHPGHGGHAGQEGDSGGAAGVIPREPGASGASGANPHGGHGR